MNQKQWRFSKNSSLILLLILKFQRAVLRFKNCPSIIAIQPKFKGGDAFYLKELEKEEIKK